MGPLDFVLSLVAYKIDFAVYVSIGSPMFHAPTSKETVSSNTNITTPCGNCRHRRVQCREEFEVVPEEEQPSEEEQQSDFSSSDDDYYPPYVPPPPVPWQRTWVGGVCRFLFLLAKIFWLFNLAWFVDTALRAGFGKKRTGDKKRTYEVDCVRGGPNQYCLLE